MGYPWTPYSNARAHHALPFYALRAGHTRNCLTAVSGVATRIAGGLWLSYYPLGYPMPTRPI
jgi:hypothetical protein